MARRLLLMSRYIYRLCVPFLNFITFLTRLNAVPLPYIECTNMLDNRQIKCIAIATGSRPDHFQSYEK